MSKARGLELIAASAGSGKTHQLTEIVAAAVDPATDHSIAIEGLLAVTYTRKAAAELEARIRRRLVASGAHTRAHQLALARIGTVHAVCLRLLSQHALSAGLSPEVRVLTGNATRALRQALDRGLDAGLQRRLEGLAGELEIGWDERTRRSDWTRPVEHVMALARGNRIHSRELPAMAERSSRRLLELLGRPEADGGVLDRELAEALTAAEAALSQADDGQQNTAKARETIREAARDLRRGRLRWSRWISLQKLAPGKALRPLVAPVTEVAARVDRHPRLHAQIRELTRAVYEAAAAGLEAYDDWKRQRRLVDFVDMVDRALSLLALPAVREELARELELVVVDEFQDTSPAQLALFVTLHELSGRSTWVGDRKQCIFEYAGADPTLMDSIARWVPGAGGVTHTLRENRRSRPELVDFCSRLFTRALAPHGYRAEEVAMLPVREPLASLARLPPLGLFLMQGKGREADATAIASGIERLLQAPDATPVVDRATQVVRPLRLGDIAVLVLTNDEAARVTTALAKRGIRASIARAGVLDTPEGVLVEAALGTLVDARGGRERAVVVALTGFDGLNPDAWLERTIRARRCESEARAAGERLETPPESPVLQRLAALRTGLELLAPSEVLERVLEALDLGELCARWPDPEQRLGNIDALRALAKRYEARCGEQREAASVAGLLRHFSEAREKQRVGDEELASDDQHVSLAAHAATVTTYHRAKGLEWPVVILSSLDRGPRDRAFDVSPESDRLEFDPEDPLGGRWIRYFPWPFGTQRSAPLAGRVADAPEGAAVSERECRERVRLLYVGFTRARDHLILALRVGSKKPSTAWLEELRDEQGEPLLSLPLHAEEPGVGAVARIRGKGEEGGLAARVWLLDDTEAPAAEMTRERPHWFAKRGVPVGERLPYRIAPSAAASEWPGITLGRVGTAHRSGARLALGSESPKDWSIVGDALHAFLAADLPELSHPRRLAIAERLLARAELSVLLEPTALLHAGDQLRRWIEAAWPHALWHREVPIAAALPTRHGARRIEGVIDLLLQTRAGVVLIDHKSYPGQRHTWCDKATEYLPQLAAYARALRMADQVVLSQWISFPMVGAMVEVKEDASQVSPPEAVVVERREP